MRSMRAPAVLCALAALVLALRGAPLFAADGEGFRSEGSSYISTASGTGASEAAAEAKARSAALHGLFAGLGKDGLFAEVFSASPPLGLNFQVIKSSREGLGFKAQVLLKVDDESIRIVERGPYLAAALGILDKAESFSDEADARRESAAAAEAAGDLGAALVAYGMAVDACRSALQLIGPVEDPSIFSSKGKRTAPELKKGLASTLTEGQAGIERLKKAEAALAADATTAAASEVADAALAVAAEAQALLDEAKPLLSDLSAFGEERLSPLRDRVATQRRKLSDSMAALQRAQASLPKAGGGYSGDKIDFAARRLSTADDSLHKAYSALDREIRDPSARRAARAQTIRWAFLHEPREYLSLRTYLPFSLAAGEGGLAKAEMDGSLALEGAFSMGRGGVWVHSQMDFAHADLDPENTGGLEQALTQSFDLGFYGRSLVFAGYGWDWLRRVDEDSLPKKGAVRLGLGGVYEHRAGEEHFQRADWLLALSYELPYANQDRQLLDLFNLGFESKFRLGNIALLEASLSRRLDKSSVSAFAWVYRWSVGLGLRLPPPFALGCEYYGGFVQSPPSSGAFGEVGSLEDGRFRFFLQYSI